LGKDNDDCHARYGHLFRRLTIELPFKESDWQDDDCIDDGYCVVTNDWVYQAENDDFCMFRVYNGDTNSSHALYSLCFTNGNERIHCYDYNTSKGFCKKFCGSNSCHLP